MAAAAELESYQLLAHIFDEQCERAEQDADDEQNNEEEKSKVVVRSPRTSNCSTVISPAYPDARHNRHKGTGYVVQIMEAYQVDEVPERVGGDVPEKNLNTAKPDLVTHAAIGKSLSTTRRPSNRHWPMSSHAAKHQRICWPIRTTDSPNA